MKSLEHRILMKIDPLFLHFGTGITGYEIGNAGVIYLDVSAVSHLRDQL